MRSLIRKVIFYGALIATGAAILWYFNRLNAELPLLVYATGWLLLGLMLYLTGYNARKKLPFLPLTSSRVWLQAHIYLGLITGLIFLLHLNWRWPTGWFELVLAALFAIVTLSGIFGWWLSRTLPKRLTTAGGEVPFDRIPIIRRAIQLEAEKLVLKGIEPAQADTLADFYAARLADFFSGPANFAAHLVGSTRPLNNILGQIAEVDRFVNATEKKTVATLCDLVRQKNSLDFHRTAQIMMKAWLFVHIPLTYGLLVFSFVHVVIVYTFSGGAR